MDRALLVFACDKPLLEAKQLTRFLVSMEATKVPFDLVLNKADLISDVEKADWTARLEQWGYAPIFVSVATGEGVDELETYLARKSESVGGDFPSDAAAAQGAFAEERSKARDDGDGEMGNRDTAHDATGQIPSSSAPTNFRSRVTVLAGPSGVGKSSLINRLRAGSALAVALQEAGEFDEVECEEGDLDLDGEDDDGDDEDEGTGTSESYNSATGTSDEDTTATGTKKTVFRKQKNRFITDVDISGGGGGARGSLSLVMKSGVELQSVKSVSAKVRGFPTEHVPPSRLPILVLTKGRLRPEGTILSDCYPDCFRNTMEYSIPFPIPHTNPSYTLRPTDTFLLIVSAGPGAAHDAARHFVAPEKRRAFGGHPGVRVPLSGKLNREEDDGRRVLPRDSLGQGG